MYLVRMPLLNEKFAFLLDFELEFFLSFHLLSGCLTSVCLTSFWFFSSSTRFGMSEETRLRNSLARSAAVLWGWFFFLNREAKSWKVKIAGGLSLKQERNYTYKKLSHINQCKRKTSNLILLTCVLNVHPNYKDNEESFDWNGLQMTPPTEDFYQILEVKRDVGVLLDAGWWL